jgi:hypothetical protein
MVVQGIFALDIEIKGKVLQSGDRAPVEFANVVLQTSDSVFVTGEVTDRQGSFVMNSVPAGDYRVIITCIGFEPQVIELEGETKNIDLKEILLEESAIEMEGVTVTASATTSKSDRKLIYPSGRQVNASTNGVDLLQQLMLPKVQVNPLQHTISLIGGGEVQYRINGVKVEIQDIIALKPADVIRIEYHDNPGLRYGNAEVVLDYIVHRPETGGNIGINSGNSPVYEWGNNYINGRINHKKSEFSVNYGVMHRNFYNMWRDNEETFTFADGSQLKRKEVGEPSHMQMLTQNLNASYSYQDGKRMFNATVRYNTNDQPHGDFKGTLINVANPADQVRMEDLSSSKYYRPAIDLYYQQNLRQDQTLVLNVVGTYNYSDNTRIYHESRDNILLTDVNNNTIGKKYSVIGEGIYEKKMGNNRISAGLKHTQSFTDNEYRNGQNFHTEMTQMESYMYAEFRGKVQKLDYTLGAGVTRSYFGQEGGEGYQNYTFNPRIVLHLALPGNSFIRLKSDIVNTAPSLSNLSDIEQTIDSLQIQRGNPNLKPYLNYRNELTYELQKGIFYANVWGMFEYQPKAIMDEKYLDGDKIVQTWDNQQSWQRLAGRSTLRVGPVKQILTMSLTGGVNHYISNGNHYNHTYTNWFGNVDVTAMYKKMMINVGIQTNWNWFYGETLNGGENIHYLMIGYRNKSLSLGAGMINPFVDNYKVENENRSQYASYKKNMYIKESSRLLVFNLTYNFSFGRTFKGEQKRLNNADNDSGVMSTGK